MKQDERTLRMRKSIDEAAAQWEREAIAMGMDADEVERITAACSRRMRGETE